MRVGLAVLLLSLLAIAQSSMPENATCPYDGDLADLESTVGSGSGRVCWYGHDHMETDPTIRTVHHKFYQACPDGN
jgi:hypothetical protein